MTEIIIFDIDGTLANIEHRLPLINGEGKSDWDAFHAACVDDAPISEMLMVAQVLLYTVFPIHLVTGRMEKSRADTTGWLTRNLVEFNRLWMRADGDTRPDFEIKREILGQIRGLGFEPILVFDDRQQVVDMWREEGIRCCQVAKGDY